MKRSDEETTQEMTSGGHTPACSRLPFLYCPRRSYPFSNRMDDRERTRSDAGDATTGTMLRADHSLDVLLDGGTMTISQDGTEQLDHRSRSGLRDIGGGDDSARGIETPLRR